MLISFEGIDGIGKGTVLYGWEEGATYEEGYLARLARRGIEVTKAKAPGTAEFYPMSLERSLNQVDFFLWAAQECTRIDVRPQMEAVRYLLHRVRTLAWNGFNEEAQVWEPAHFERPRVPRTDATRQKNARWQRLLKLDPTIAMRMQRYHARDCIRHALLHCADSAKLGPIGTTLLFTADHALNQSWLKAQAGLVISDRYVDSERVYGPLRGTPEFIMEIYEGVIEVEADVTVLLTCSIEEMEERLSSRSGFEQAKQEGKFWNLMEFRRRAQEEYLRLAQKDPYRWRVVDTTGMTPYDTIAAVDDVLGL